MNEFINEECVCRTAPATPGLLIMHLVIQYTIWHKEGLRSMGLIKPMFVYWEDNLEMQTGRTVAKSKPKYFFGIKYSWAQGKKTSKG